MRRANYQQLKIIQMEAKDYLKKIGITERVLNSEDLPEYWKSLSQLMEDYAALRKPLVSGSLPSDDVPLMIWANIYNPIKPNSWDLHHTENGAVINAIGGVKTHCYIHESVLGNDR